MTNSSHRGQLATPSHISSCFTTRTVGCRILGLLVAGAMLCSPATATVFDVDVVFTATDYADVNGTVSPPPADVVSSEFSFQFDDSVVQGLVGEIFKFPSTTVHQFSIGGASFDASNTEVFVGYEFGVLASVVFGGIPADVIGVGNDDFSLRMLGSSFDAVVFDDSAYTLNAFDRAFFRSTTGSVVATVFGIPESSSVVLSGLACLGLLTSRRCRL